MRKQRLSRWDGAPGGGRGLFFVAGGGGEGRWYRAQVRRSISTRSSLPRGTEINKHCTKFAVAT